jgi:hypothetical protein
VNCMAGEPSCKKIREAIEALNEIENYKREIHQKIVDSRKEHYHDETV